MRGEKKLSANVREDREIFIHVCESLKLRMTRVTRGRRDRGRKREEAKLDKWSSTVRRSTQRYRREKESRSRQNAHKHREWQIYIINVIIHPTLRPPRVWGTKSVGQWILTKSCLTEKIGLFWSAFASTRYIIFIYIRLRIVYIYNIYTPHTYITQSLATCSQYPHAHFVSSNGIPLTREAFSKRASTFPYLMGIFLLTVCNSYCDPASRVNQESER